MKPARLIRLTVGIVAAGFLGCVYAQQTTVDPNGKSTGGLANALVFGAGEPDFILCAGARVGEEHGCTATGPTGEGITSARTGPPIADDPQKYPNQYGLDFYTSSVARVSITHAGLVGIGTQNPTALLDIQHSGDADIGITSSDPLGRRWTLRSGGQTSQGSFEIVDTATDKPRVQIDATGLVSVRAIKITGGSDLSEPFKTTSALPAGAVVSIDSKNVGALKISDRAYDRRVAGIVSGAGGVSPGLTLEQLDSNGSTQQVALSGRVYALANTRGGKIRAGDMLTTSSVPGEAMRVTDLHIAQGSIIGKAMSSLNGGSGLVLVLVSPH